MILVLDTETTGLTAPIGICEIAWAVLGDDLNIEDEFSTLVNPGMPIEHGASGIHNIRDEDVVDAPLITDLPWPTDPVLLVTHNVAFDRPLVEDHLDIVDDLCTLRLARRLLRGSPDHKLGTLTSYCELPKQLAHRALNDVRATVALLDYLVEGSGMTVQELADFLKKPVRLSHVPWGKHKGKEIKDLPYGYVRWLRELPDLDMDFKYSLDLIFG